MRKYDIFFSYRREGGSETAKHLRDTLTEKGYRVFLDVESLRAGQFNTELYRIIEQSTDFLLILPPNGLDRCQDENDWLRLEIEHAIKFNKNIIPVMLKGFEFPDELPESMEFLRTQNGLIANVEYYDAFVSKLLEFLQSKHRVPNKQLLLSIIIAAIIFGVLIFFGIRIFSGGSDSPSSDEKPAPTAAPTAEPTQALYPGTPAERNTVTSLIAYMVRNLENADLAGTEYQKMLKESGRFLRGESAYPLDTLLAKLDKTAENLSGYRNGVTEMDEELRRDLKESPFDSGDLTAFPTYLRDTLDEYETDIRFLRDYIDRVYTYTNGNIVPEDKVMLLSLLDATGKLAELDADNMFISLNQTFLPVKDESVLTELKRDYLPKFTFIYAHKPDYLYDNDILNGKLETNYNLAIQLLAECEEYQRYFEERFYSNP